MLYDKFEKVEDSDGESEVLEDPADQAGVLGDGVCCDLDLWPPGGLASERALASGAGAAIRRSRTLAADLAPLRSQLFAG